MSSCRQPMQRSSEFIGGLALCVNYHEINTICIITGILSAILRTVNCWLLVAARNLVQMWLVKKYILVY